VPIYTYECQSCGSSLERRQSFNDEPLKTHDDCGGSLRRVIYPAGIVFKGSGFYNTDYKNSTGSTKPAAESGESKTEGAKAESSSSDNGTAAAATSSASSNGSSDSSAKSESSAASSSSPAPSTP
jgi:putative FmdB family regulatory protein